MEEKVTVTKKGTQGPKLSRYLIRLPALLILFTFSFHQIASASTPFATGLAALILSQNPSFTPDQVMTQITSSSQDVNQSTFPGEDDHLGSGRIHLLNALTLALTPAEETAAQTTIEYTYDFENRLTQVTYPDNSASQYFPPCAPRADARVALGSPPPPPGESGRVLRG